MKQNVGTIDRVLRVAAGIGLIAWAVTSGNVVGYIGVVPLLTAAIGWCPAYTLFGIKTCSCSGKNA